MVVFTCNHCGDSIQKPKVEKHINIECRKKFLNPQLCCIDCLKDFNRQTYVEHTKCVTEEERYSGKGFVPKASSNKGEKKQESWVEIIQTVLKKPQLSEQQRRLLKAVSNYQNVPRKQNKFKNFVSTSFRHFNVREYVVDEVYQLIDNEFKSSQAANSAQKPVQKKDSDSQQPAKSETEKSDVQPSEKKNKKNKLKDIENTSISEEPSTETVEIDETAAKEGQKKKKNKKENEENLEVAVSEEPPKDVNLDESVAFEVVKKKKKSKKKDAETENVNVEAVKVEITEPSDNPKRSLENDIDQDIPMKGISKKKLKKLKLQEVQENSPDDSQINVTSTETELNSNEAAPESTPPKENGETEPILNVAAPESTSPKENGADKASENLSRKQRKELKKKLKYEAELKAIETEVVQPVDSITDDQEPQTDANQKRDKKKKRKLNENIENEEVASKKTKLVENGTTEAEDVQPLSKFSWEEVIRTVLEKAEGKEMSLKKLTKKAVAEYQSCHSEEKPYEEVLKRFNKKIHKLPFVKILKDKVKLSA